MPLDKRRGRKRKAPRKAQQGAVQQPPAKSPASVWRQVAERLEQDIARGRYQEGGRLPTEAQLTAQLSVSRHSLRRAIEALVDKGVLRTIPHIGVFVAPGRITFAIGLDTRFAEGVRAAGLRPGVRQLSRQTGSPPAEVAKALGVAARTQVIEIVHLLLANDLPVGCVTLWLPADRFARIGELLDATGSLRRALAQLGVQSYRRKEATIAARLADPTERQWLGLAPGTDAIVISARGVSVDAAGEPTHAFHYRLLADRVALVVEP